MTQEVPWKTDALFSQLFGPDHEFFDLIRYFFPSLSPIPGRKVADIWFPHRQSISFCRRTGSARLWYHDSKFDKEKAEQKLIEFGFQPLCKHFYFYEGSENPPGKKISAHVSHYSSIIHFAFLA